MELGKKHRIKNGTESENQSRKRSSRINVYVSKERKRVDSQSIRNLLSLSLSNSLKKIAHTNSASNLKVSSIRSPKSLIDINPPPTTKKVTSRNVYPNPLHNRLKPNLKKILTNSTSPMPPRLILSHFGNELTEYERSEILSYKDIYFFAKLANKITPNSNEINFGFDDERGDYVLIAEDHIAYRYEIIKMLGKGNFGQVALCHDHKRNEKVALKIVRNKKRFNQQATVEIKVLQTLLENDLENKSHAVQIKNYFVFRKHVCMTFQQLSMNLYELLHKNNFEGFSLSLVHKFTSQILQCLSFAYKFRIIHCDLKPENLMLIALNKAEINVIDFGSSCFESEKLYTYIQSRFYRAPEIILGIPYTPAIDMWSLGCIIVEFCNGYPLFTGESEHDQLLLIIELIGLPPDRVMKYSTRLKLFFDASGNPKPLLNKQSDKIIPGNRRLRDVLGKVPDLLFDLVNRCLDWDPNTRLKPYEALKHPWITNFKNENIGKSNESKKSKNK